MKDVALVDTLVDRPPEVHGETLSETLAKVKAQPLKDALDDTLLKVEIEALSNTLFEVKAKSLVDVMPDIVAEVKIGTLKKNGQSKGQGTSQCSG